MQRKKCYSVRRWSSLFMGFAMVTISACNSGSAAKNAGGREVEAGSSNTGAHVDVMCIGDRINNPSEAFHYSYKHTDANGWVEDEAEITPQAMDIIIKDKSGSHTFHGVHSDEGSWSSAVADLSHLNITAMSSRLNALSHPSAIVQLGRESINGYDTASIPSTLRAPILPIARALEHYLAKALPKKERPGWRPMVASRNSPWMKRSCRVTS